MRPYCYDFQLDSTKTISFHFIFCAAVARVSLKHQMRITALLNLYINLTMILASAKRKPHDQCVTKTDIPASTVLTYRQPYRLTCSELKHVLDKAMFLFLITGRSSADHENIWKSPKGDKKPFPNCYNSHREKPFPIPINESVTDENHALLFVFTFRFGLDGVPTRNPNRHCSF